MEETLHETQAQQSPEEELREAREARYAYQKLQELRGWDLLVKIAEDQIAWRHEQSSQLAENAEEAFRNEMLKREIAGIKLILKLPELVIEDMDEQIEDLKRVIGEDENVD